MNFEYITAYKIKESEGRKFTSEELELLKKVKNGETVVCNNYDPRYTKLIQWAKENGKYIDIDHHRSKWKPHLIYKVRDGAVIKKVKKLHGNKFKNNMKEYVNLFEENTELHAHVMELKGKVLGNRVYPSPNHGDFLKEIVNQNKYCSICGYYTGYRDDIICNCFAGVGSKINE
jgi:hypothetical protein